MGTNSDSNCVAVFDRHQDAETAIHDLQRGGFDMKKLSPFRPGSKSIDSFKNKGEAMVRITYRDIEHTGVIDAHIQKRAEKLSSGAPLAYCRVVVDAPHRQKHTGRHYVVHIEASSAGGDMIIVDRAPDAARKQENVFAAIDAAFDHAVRQLRDHARRSYVGAWRRTRAVS